jgi:hypothetical protein
MDQSTDAIPCLLRQAGDNYEMKRDGNGKPFGWVLKPEVIKARRRRRRHMIVSGCAKAAAWAALAFAIAYTLETNLGWRPCELFGTCL